MKICRFVHLFILLFAPTLLFSGVQERNLNDLSWKFRKAGNKKWYSAAVPGTVHTDLLKNKLIPDPFFGNNEKELQWIENESWEYKTNFTLTRKDLENDHLELSFEGLDTYAKVYVNDSLIITADNMFRSWKAEVKKCVHKGKNTVLIIFTSAVKQGKAEAKKLSYTLPGEEKVFSRKAQYQYGWDWGPRFVTCGIWKNVNLCFWNDARIRNVKYVQRSLTDKVAELEFICEIESDIEQNVYIDIIKGNKKDLSGQIISKVKLKKGFQTYSVFYDIREPQRWWSNGMGFPTMYDFTIDLSYDSHSLDTEGLKIGLRTIELVQDADSLGSSFYFKLNGIPVFMKGANYIPPDNFLPRVKKEDYQRIIQNAAAANMNMLRVWGGGVYADDEFYNECDQKGILVWQDFMFACAMYPGDDHFIENVDQEVIEQVERLRNHPCIALWCGNNEVDEGWKNWGWQKQYNYSAKDSAAIGESNRVLFNHFIKDMVNAYDGSRAYWPSSPGIGWGHKESLQQGDSHYWGVWWGMQPFEVYEEKVGRFMSEYGFQGMPSLNTMKKMGAFNKGVIDSLSLKNHQKHPSGFQTINAYLERDYKAPKKIEDHQYLSQLLQAKGMKIAIEAHRRAKPYCMGTLYWQLNDCWPVTSWSTFDHYNEWKASHYQVKRSFEDVLISIEEKRDSCSVYLLSDLQKEMRSKKLTMELFDLSGNVLFSKSLPVIIEPNSSTICYQFEKALAKRFDQSSIVLKCTVSDSAEFTSGKNMSSLHYFVTPKNLNLQKPDLRISVEVCGGAQCFFLQTDVLMKDVHVSIEGESINLSDNYFDLLPGFGKTIYLPRGVKVSNLAKRIRVRSLIDTY